MLIRRMRGGALGGRRVLFGNSRRFTSNFGIPMAGGASSELEWPVSRVRSTFVRFFEERGHKDIGSAPVVPNDDPTLLFVNAGMAPLKSKFLGTVDPSSPLADLKRAANSQRCLRAGGKHNDLEDVGKDVYHHSAFEMLGNWSFGDYFKKEAIEWAWELLTEVYHLPVENLYATYFEGDEDVPVDDVSRDVWLKFLPPERIIASSKKDNFWEMGPVGPCGPCTEIHYDRLSRGGKVPELVNADDPSLVEIWNIVAMQFYRNEDGSLSRLPDQHIDTGLGLERLTSILQNVQSNYDCDAFTPLLAAIEKETGARPYSGKVGAEDVDGVDMAYRVVADHIRALTFSITDGAVPSNEGRGYVLRRILRRAVRYGRETLGASPGFFTRLVPAMVEHYGDFFPELRARASFVEQVLSDEEESFGRTLDRGIKWFKKRVATLREEGGEEFRVLPGADAFFLYDSMGFPFDLTEIMAEERGLSVDKESFQACMEEQRERSRQGAKGGREGRTITLPPELIKRVQDAGTTTTEDELKFTWNIEPAAKVLAIFRSGDWILDSGVRVEPAEAPAGEEGEGGAGGGGGEDGGEGRGELLGVILDRTSFYCTAGGQETDFGKLRVLAGDPAAGTEVASSGADALDEEESRGEFEVEGASSFAGYVLHAGSLRSGSIAVGDTVRCGVDYERRSLLAPNHTMTHALNFALRKTLGGEVDQKGSLVSADKLRFDFSSSRALTGEEVASVDEIVNDLILKAAPVYTKVCPLAEARAISALRAVFGETYPDPVRVVSIGQPIEPMIADPANEAWQEYSVEFCGGTHLSNSAKAECFVTVEEGSIAKGIRRMVCLTRDAAKVALDNGAELDRRLTEALLIPSLSKREAALASVKVSLDSTLLPYAVKLRIRSKFEDAMRALKKSQKVAAAAAAEAFTTQVAALLEGSGASGEGGEAGGGGGGGGGGGDGDAAEKVVDVLHATDSVLLVRAGESVGSNAKAIKGPIDSVTKAKGSRALCLIATGPAIALGAYLPESVSTTTPEFSATSWLDAATSVEGFKGKVRAGKGGAAFANGSAPSPEAVEAVVEAIVTKTKAEFSD